MSEGDCVDAVKAKFAERWPGFAKWLDTFARDEDELNAKRVSLAKWEAYRQGYLDCLESIKEVSEE